MAGLSSDKEGGALERELRKARVAHLTCAAGVRLRAAPSRVAHTRSTCDLRSSRDPAPSSFPASHWLVQMRCAAPRRAAPAVVARSALHKPVLTRPPLRRMTTSTPEVLSNSPPEVLMTCRTSLIIPLLARCVVFPKRRSPCLWHISAPTSRVCSGALWWSRSFPLNLRLLTRPVILVCIQ